MKKEQNQLDLTSFLGVFDWNVWIAILISVLVVGLVVFILEKFSPYSSMNSKDELISKSQIHFNFKESHWFSIGGFLLAGGESPPRTLSTRVVIWGFYIFSSICLSTYQANLAAFLTVKRLKQPISSINDLPYQNEIKYSLGGGTSVQSYFEDMMEIEENFYNFWIKSSLLNHRINYLCRNGPNNLTKTDLLGYGEKYLCKENAEQVKNVQELFNFLDYETLWEYPLGNSYSILVKQMKKTGYLNSSSEGIRRVLNSSPGEKFAFFIDYPSALYATMKNCDLEMIGEQFSSRPYAMGVPKNSYLRDLLSKELLILQSESTLNNLKVKWWNYESSNCVDSTESDTQINLSALGGVFIFCAIFIFLALVAMVFEFFYFKNIYKYEEKKVDLTTSIIFSDIASNGNENQFESANI